MTLVPITVLAAFAFVASAATLGPAAIILWVAGAAVSCLIDPYVEGALDRWQKAHRR